MNSTILNIRNLRVLYEGGGRPAVDRLDLSLVQAQSLGIVGESGSGKSTLALSLMGLLPRNALLEGEFFFKNVFLHRLSEEEWKALRWNRIALVFQNSLNVLNPLLSLGEQISETLKTHTTLTRRERREKTAALLESVGLESFWGEAFPHQISGGMRQKVLIAMALACEPELLILDEPTMALDAEAKEQIISLLLELKSRWGFGMIVISHELEIINRLTNRIMVMYGGKILEEGITREVLESPRHPYTRGLVSSSPALNPFRDLWGIPGSIDPVGGTSSDSQKEACPFADRCRQSLPVCFERNPVLEDCGDQRQVACLRGGIVTRLKGLGLSKSFLVGSSVIKACRNCSLLVRSGEIASLIGESGSGKSTLSAILAGLTASDTGEVFFEDRSVELYSETSRRGGIQYVHQDPMSAINSQFSVQDAVREPLDIIKWKTRREQDDEVLNALLLVGLPDDQDFSNRSCSTLSGGQKQRVALARAMVMNPRLLIADEISAMLDPSTTANILRLLKGLQNERGFSMLYVTHDLALARKIADTVFVMKEGEIIEDGPLKRVFRHPRQDYTKRLISLSGGGTGHSPSPVMLNTEELLLEQVSFP